MKLFIPLLCFTGLCLSEVWTDLGSDSSPGSYDCNSGSNSVSVSGSESGSDSGSESVSDSGSESVSDSGSDSGSGSGSEYSQTANRTCKDTTIASGKFQTN
jgi:hypothetical protein